MKNELREKIAWIICDKYHSSVEPCTNCFITADQILALLPPRLSEEELKNEIDKIFYPDCHTHKALTTVALGHLVIIRDILAHSLAGRIEKVERCECKDKIRTPEISDSENGMYCKKCRKPIIEEKEYCQCNDPDEKGRIYLSDNVIIACSNCYKPVNPKPRQYEHTKIELLDITNHSKNELDTTDKNILNISNKINELIQSTEKLWEVIEKGR